MEKKFYVSPEVEVLEIENESNLLAGTFDPTKPINVDTGGGNEGGENDEPVF